MQDALAILFVALAAAFLARRAWRHVVHRAASACGSCANCPDSDSAPQTIVTISPVVSHAKAPSRKVSTADT
jgi:hypothetical protein